LSVHHGAASEAREITMRFDIPPPLRVEHEALHQRLVAATSVAGDVGAAAREVARVLHPHFVREEAFALPPLGLLSRLARGPATPDMAPVLEMTRRLEAELPAMLDEHRGIVGALERLVEAARAAGDTDVEAFANALILHAQTEEDVMYPAAILVGHEVERAVAQGAKR
jgi:hypothetical protein